MSDLEDMLRASLVALANSGEFGFAYHRGGRVWWREKGGREVVWDLERAERFATRWAEFGGSYEAPALTLRTAVEAAKAYHQTQDAA